MKFVCLFFLCAFSAYGASHDALEIAAEVSGECVVELAQDFFEIDLENKNSSVVAIKSASNFREGYSLQFDFFHNGHLTNGNHRLAIHEVFLDNTQVTDHLIVPKTHSPNLGIFDVSYLRFHFESSARVKLLQGKYSEIVTITCLAN